MREVSEQDGRTRHAIGVTPTSFSTRGPKSIPRVDYERIFVLDSRANLLGEYALNDECPLESADLMRSLPVSGLRHLVTFFQGEFTYTPFRVDDLWFVILTRGILRIEERGSVGTLLAAARVHIPPMMDPMIAKRESDLRAREQELASREAELAQRELRAATVDADLRITSTRLKEMEVDVRSQEAKLIDLRDYAMQMQRTFAQPKTDKGKDGSSSPSLP